MLEDALGRQALHHASQAGASAATQLLITEGASVNAKATETGLTALHYAAKVRVGQPRSQSLHVHVHNYRFEPPCNNYCSSLGW